MAAAEPISPPRSAWELWRDRRSHDSPSEGECGGLLLSPLPPRAISAMTGPVISTSSAQVNSAQHPTQTHQYTKGGQQSFDSPHTFQTPNILQALPHSQASTMDTAGMNSFSTAAFHQALANRYNEQSYLTYDHHHGMPVQSYNQQPSPMMSRTPSWGNEADHSVANASSMAIGHDPYAYLPHNHIYDAQIMRNSGASNRQEVEENEGGELPYATLIFRALMSKKDHQMVLKDIYDWFEKNTEKAKDPSSRGWQNSIRHNLSMNGVSYRQTPRASKVIAMF